MKRFNNTIEFKYAGDSRLFNHYRQFFDENVVEEFRRINDSDSYLTVNRNCRYEKVTVFF